MAGLTTAFVARWDSPAGANGPVLGIIGEYDALRGTQEPFHGDQHNAQSPVAIAAAVALKEYMTQHKVAGSIRIFGTPAEEVGPPAKSIMRDAGVFKRRRHPDPEPLHLGHRSLPGRLRHLLPQHQRGEVHLHRAPVAPADAAGTAATRSRPRCSSTPRWTACGPVFRPEASIQGVIPEGGVAPNVVPDRAVVDYYVRYPDGVYLEHIQEMMDNAARGAALATGTEVKIDRYGEYRDGITVGTLEEAWFAYAKKLGAPQVTPDLQRPAGFEETGGVSQDIPGVGVTAFSSRGSYHTYEMLDDAFTDVGHTAFRIDAQVMSAVLYHFLTDAEFRAAVKEEHRALAALFSQYQQNLKKAYAPEVGSVVP